MSRDYDNHAGGERRCVECSQTFNLDEGGTDYDPLAGGPLCIRHEDLPQWREDAEKMIRAGAETESWDEYMTAKHGQPEWMPDQEGGL